MYDVMLSQLNYKAAQYLNGGGAPTRQAMGAHTFYVPAQLFETADGYLALFVTHDEFWRRVCAELGRPEWSDDPRYATMHARFEHRDQLLADLTAVLKEATAEQWTARLRPLGVPVGPVADLDEVLEGDLVRERGMVVSVDTADGPLRMVGNPIHVVGVPREMHVPPRLHEHTDEVSEEIKRRS